MEYRGTIYIKCCVSTTGRVFYFSMAPLVLFLFSALAAWPLGFEARVVTDFQTCNQFFYKNTEPTGIDQNAVKICQKKGFDYYASLYSTSHRMPVYSAYTIDHTCRNNDLQRRGVWFIEPQVILSG